MNTGDRSEATPDAFTLWHRASRRCKWRGVGGAATEPLALALIDASGFRGGDWCVMTAGVDPNAKESVK